MPRRNVPETPKIILPDYNPDDEITPNTVVNSKYADRFELRWNVPHDNGELIDSYYIRYCVVSTYLFFCLKEFVTKLPNHLWFGPLSCQVSK